VTLRRSGRARNWRKRGALSSDTEITMLETAQSVGLLTILEILGPIVLAGGLVYGIYHSRRRRNHQPPPKPGTIYAQDR